MNPVLILTRNNLALTQRCVGSSKQDIEHQFYFVDNGSTDGTREWLLQQCLRRPKEYGALFLPDNDGVSCGWNLGLGKMFCETKYDHVLVIGNDTVLPPWFYRELLSYDVPFVTGVAVDNMEQALRKPERGPLTNNPDFSAFLIRRDAWEKIGPFDERMVHYCSDCDYHIRGHRLGVGMFKAPVAYYHERSSTLRLASPEEQVEIQTQANKDREVFRSIYGCLPGDDKYSKLFE